MFVFPMTAKRRILFQNTLNKKEMDKTLDATQEIIDFIEKNQERFYRVAFAYVKNKDNALDVVHNAIVKALQKQHSLRKRQYLQTWFFRILINESITFIHKNKKVIFFDDLAELEDLSVSNGVQEEYFDLYSAIDHLPVKLKTVIILRYFEDMKLSAIAEITSTNLSTTKSRLYKALEVLKLDMEGIEND